MEKEEAVKILNEWVESKNLKKHMLAVAAAMSFYAKKFDEDENKWWVTGLLHDLDYEKYPDYKNGGHPYKVVEFLKSREVDGDISEAILGHAAYTNVPRKSLMAKTLFAVDELAGFIVAVALIKPEKSLSAVNVDSVKKRLKEARFASGVNRQEIYEGVKDLEISLDEHVQNVIDGMKVVSKELGL